MPSTTPDFAAFERLASSASPQTLVPICRRLLSDQLTPVLAYRRLVQPDARMAPSFLFESVVGGERIGRFSFLGAQPMAQVIAHDHDVQVLHATDAEKSRRFRSDDPLGEMQRLVSDWVLKRPGDTAGLPDFTGGWVGYAGYDTVRYLEGEKLPSPPRDDRGLPDMHMQLYRRIVAFDHVQKTIVVITNVLLGEHASLRAAYEAGQRELDELVERIETPLQRTPELPYGELDLSTPPRTLPTSTMGDGGYQRAVVKAKEYIAAGDIFQVVPSQRFELHTQVDPFEVYRALRVVNPSPYMFYLQFAGGMLVGSSPEILCRVENGVVTNRPLAGTRRRGRTAQEDRALEAELLADPKERAEHIMLVDLGRNDVGRVCEPGTIALPDVMVVERYSHVMHISSTVTGRLRPGCTCWDALRYSLPVGTVSGAPKVRAMQIIDELEPTRRGPYAGAVGYVDLSGNMDMAIALRTMVVMPENTSDEATENRGRRSDEVTENRGRRSDEGEESKQSIAPPFSGSSEAAPAPKRNDRSVTPPSATRPPGHSATSPSPPRPSALDPRPSAWAIHIQAGGGIVADSDPDAEHQETVNKAAALAKAVDLAESAFGTPAPKPR